MERTYGSLEMWLLHSFSWLNLAQGSSLGGAPTLLDLVSLTHISHLGDCGCVNVLGEHWLVVIDVVDLDDEFRLGLYGSPCPSVNGLSAKDVNRFFFPVQSLRGLNVACVFIDNEEISCPIS